MLFLESRRSDTGQIVGAAIGLLAVLAISACGGRNSGHALGDAGPAPVDAAATDLTNVTIDSGTDVGTDAGTDAGADAGTDAGTDAGAACTLPPVGADLHRDFDVHLAMVTGTVTLAGAALPDSPGLSTRGNVVLRERTSGDVRTLPVGATGAATFSGSMFAGNYDVSFESAANPALVGLPAAAKTRLASAVAVAGSARLDYDLRLVAVSGVVTAGGAPLPDSPGLTTRGNVVFRERASGDVRSLPVGATGAGNFAGDLFPGTYDVSFETVSSGALVGLPASAETRVATGLVLAGGADSDGGAPPPQAYDVLVASISGDLTTGGAALPDSPTLATRGNLIFRETRSGDVRTFAIPATGAGHYAGLMFAGAYDVSFQTPATATSLVGLPAASTTRLAGAVAVAGGAASLSYDLSIATVAGTLTTNGAPLPDAAGATDRGGVRFVERTTGLTSSLAVSATGAATFGGTLFAGTYDVSFASGSGGGAALVGLPAAGAKQLAAAVVVSGAATLSYDLRVVKVTGAITSGGAVLPSSPALTTRGSVVFRDRETGAGIRLSVGASGAGVFAGPVFASNYDVTFETANGAGTDLVGLPAAAETRLATKVAIDSAAPPGPFAWDTRVVTLSGQVTLDGAALPDSPALTTRGNVVFRDKLSGDVRALPLGATGPATYSGMAFAGSFDASLETAAGTNLVGLPIAAETSLDVGCLPAVSCASDPSDLTGNWTFIFRDQVSWIRWDVALTQAGSTIGGRFTGAAGYDGQFDQGMRTGDALSLTSAQNTSTCVLRIDATLSGGCFMTGVGACTSGVSQSPFVGIR